MCLRKDGATSTACLSSCCLLSSAEDAGEYHGLRRQTTSGSALVVSCRPCYSALLRCTGITMQPREKRVAPRRITLKRRVSNAALIELSKLLRGDLSAHIEAHW